MRMQGLVIALTLINLVVLLFTVAQPGLTTPQTANLSLRVRALEVVDERGQVRSRLNVEQSGEVVLRLLDKNGTIRVKLGAGVDGSGLVLSDEATEPAIHIIARRVGTSERPTTTSITLRGTGGQQRVIRP
ncbi:MAG TPA: hypothetical protein VGR25_03895 [bacterium]|nr:hypothetical protein [bacterium]